MAKQDEETSDLIIREEKPTKTQKDFGRRPDVRPSNAGTGCVLSICFFVASVSIALIKHFCQL